MMETNNPNTSPLGASSFASWDGTTQTLWSNSLKHNDREAYVFDISGMTNIDVLIAADEPATSWIGLVAVPEPNSLSLIFLSVFGLLRRKQNS